MSLFSTFSEPAQQSPFTTDLSWADYRASLLSEGVTGMRVKEKSITLYAGETPAGYVCIASALQGSVEVADLPSLRVGVVAETGVAWVYRPGTRGEIVAL